MALSMADAERMIRAAIAKAETLNLWVGVAVCDAGGRLVAYNRMDRAHWMTAYSAPAKALTSAGHNRPSAALSAQNPVIQIVMSFEGGHMIPLQGALPVYRDGELIGAIGVAGSTSQQDEDCARAGLEAL